jgi:hypothetical protein
MKPAAARLKDILCALNTYEKIYLVINLLTFSSVVTSIVDIDFEFGKCMHAICPSPTRILIGLKRQTLKFRSRVFV